MRWLLILLVAMGASVARAADRPNVLFIAIDDLNDWVGPLPGDHPHAITPNMDRLAARGVTFTNAHCQAPLCNPSRTSIMLGVRPTSTGIYGLAPWFRNVENLKDRVPLQAYFKQHGYFTLATGKIFHGGVMGEFDINGKPRGVGVKPKHKLVKDPTPEGNHPLVDWGTFDHEDKDKGDYRVASWARQQLAEYDRDEPFFMGVGFFLPHVPCYVTQKWWDMYPDDSLPMPIVKDNDRADTPMFSWYLHWRLPEPRLSWLKQHHEWRPLVRAYLASVSFVDAQVGRVVEALEKSPYADNTIIVLWSDHGWHLGSKGISGKNSLWERSTRVPLIFAGPGVVKSGRCTEAVELLDIYPTLVELCGLPAKDGLEGHSLVPQLKDPSTERAWPAITSHNQGNHTIRTEKWRYIHYADGSEELYDMVNDPQEWKNLAGDAKYDAVKAELAKYLPKVDLPPAPGSAHRVLEKKADGWYWEGKKVDPDLVVD
ncbi:sulfatase [Planctomycetales bacterium ZRK34]|nr:sulfatase [Planctomycetales bacterium ZRK34]